MAGIGIGLSIGSGGGGNGSGGNGGGAVPVAIRSANRLVALVGNSLSEQTYSQTGSQDARAYGTWINILSRGRMRVERPLVFARSGYTSAQLEDQIAAAVASPAGTVVVNVTTNDCRTAAGTMDEIRARYRDWKARLRAAGKLALWCDGQPRADAPGGDYVPERNAQLRDMVRAEMDDPDNRSLVVRTFQPLGQYPDATVPAPGMLRADNLHNAYLGAHGVARAVVDAALPFLPPYDPLARPGIVAGLNTGFTGGSAGVAPSSGGTAGGAWSIAATAGISWTMVDDERGIRWIEFDVPAVSGASIVMTGPAHSTLVGAGKLFVPGETRVDVSALWRIRAGHQNARMARCFVYDSGGQTMPYTLPAGTGAAAGTTVGPAIDATDEGTAGTMTLPPIGIAGLLNPWTGTLRANANRVMPMLAWYGLANAAATATVAFAMPQIAIVPG